MRFEIRDAADPGGKPYELAVTYYESADGKTRHSWVIPLDHAGLVELGHVTEAALLRVMAAMPVAVTRLDGLPCRDREGGS